MDQTTSNIRLLLNKHHYRNKNPTTQFRDWTNWYKKVSSWAEQCRNNTTLNSLRWIGTMSNNRLIMKEINKLILTRAILTNKINRLILNKAYTTETLIGWIIMTCCRGKTVREESIGGRVWICYRTVMTCIYVISYLRNSTIARLYALRFKTGWNISPS